MICFILLWGWSLHPSAPAPAPSVKLKNPQSKRLPILGLNCWDQKCEILSFLLHCFFITPIYSQFAPMRKLITTRGLAVCSSHVHPGSLQTSPRRCEHTHTREANCQLQPGWTCLSLRGPEINCWLHPKTAGLHWAASPPWAQHRYKLNVILWTAIQEVTSGPSTNVGPYRG